MSYFLRTNWKQTTLCLLGIFLLIGLIRSVSAASPDLEFYGMQYVESAADYDTVSDLGINTLLLEFPPLNPDEGIDELDWLATLNEAKANGFRVIAWHWNTSNDNSGWTWNDSTGEWDFTPSARSFIETVADHPALIAVYALHEPYWDGCYECGYTTAQQQKLYDQIKAIADVQVYSAFSSFVDKANRAKERDENDTRYDFADGVCDYCDTWLYPNQFVECVEENYDDECENEEPYGFRSYYNRSDFIKKLRTELAHVREVAPNSKFIWILQAFESQEAKRKLPTDARMMIDFASIVMEYEHEVHGSVDGVFWYVWDFDPNQYEEVLSDHPTLQPAVREIYDRYVAPPEIPEIKGDVDCDGEVDAVDAMFILQYEVDRRSDSGGCPLDNQETELNVSQGDVNDDGRVNSVDALLIMRCTVGFNNVFCPN